VAPKELKALRLLMDYPRGLYGSEFVVRSEGYLGRGTIYTLLERLVDKGFVREVQEEATAEYQLPRTRHIITAAGRRAVTEYCGLMGLQLVNANLA
jgi:DNA-binding PadR family transcriptional regulator